MDYLIIRMLCCLLCGVILSQTGSLIQMGTRNILASPSTLGFDGMAILWCLIFHSISIILSTDHYSVTASLLIGFPLFILVGLLFSKIIRGKEKVERIILLGLTFNLLVGAIFSLWQFLFLAFNLPFPIELWFGHFRFAATESLLVLILVEALILGGFIFWKSQLSLFTLGPGLSQNWNMSEKNLFKYFFCAVAVGTLVVISLFGGFSFLALIFPIMSRKLWFRSQGLKGEFVFGSIGNGCALMSIDFICYHFPMMGAEIPVGLIVTAVGAVSLILLLWQGRSHGIIGKA